MERVGSVQRKTAETDIRLSLNLDGRGGARVETGVGFFDHMLTSFARHSLFDLEAQVRGDLHVDAHHTVEDTGLCLGQALGQALGERAGIRRFGDALVPMDEALVLAAADLSGRPLLAWDVPLPQGVSLGAFDASLAEEFFRAVAATGGLTLHMRALAGSNAHHLIEAAFKAAARALGAATRPDPRVRGVPSTKGVLG